MKLEILIIYFLCSILTFLHEVIGKIDNDYVFRTLTGEPNYRSVNLTWEIEIPHLNMTGNELQTNESLFPKTFQIYFCEIQSFGPHRCRSKILEYNQITDDKSISNSSIKYYSTTIDNLRMATKYSFHIKPQIKRKIAKITGRMGNMENEVEPESIFNGQTIVVPTKGFSAEATKCLPHASEIEVETGPHFAGKIVVDGSNCGIKGDPKSSNDKYIMRIDHEKCGSLVKPETNTVETFITVQENLGIFTHSTRRFVVVCTFQSGTQTVRASFTVPGKGGAISSIEENDPFEPDTRSARNRKFRYVDKSHLILKENSAINNSSKNEIQENPTHIIDPDAENSVAELINYVPDINEDELKMNSEDMLGVESEKIENIFQVNNAINRQAKFARLIHENAPQSIADDTRNRTTNYTTGILIAVSLSVIMIGVFVFVVKRELKRQSQICKRRSTPRKPAIIIKNP
ncbi:uncharacterized protein LOC129605258 [Condylostylus longicornis]|uniref:uncharacterized protein LOC129605258 n=1 Tax=Condylostylus longicornis TaxID=2530218 RepID=UPI00244DE740|nr:uncharacterized protein LOC129605258 [Condylostylus longicornis]